MTNEQYLIVSYFAVAGGAIAAGGVSAAFLLKPLGQATARLTVAAGRLAKRSLLAWLVLAALLGFLSVGYFGSCDHTTYKEIVEDRPWLILKTHEQIYQLGNYLTVALLTYSLALAVTLSLAGRKLR